MFQLLPNERQAAASGPVPLADVVPPFPEPQAEDLGILRLLATIWRNPLEAWTQRHFQELIVVQRSIFGEIVVVSEPAAVRRVLMDNAANYQKGRLQQRVLGSAMREGLLMADCVEKLGRCREVGGVIHFFC